MQKIYLFRAEGATQDGGRPRPASATASSPVKRARTDSQDNKEEYQKQSGNEDKDELEDIEEQQEAADGDFAERDQPSTSEHTCATMRLCKQAALSIKQSELKSTLYPRALMTCLSHLSLALDVITCMQLATCPSASSCCMIGIPSFRSSIGCLKSKQRHSAAFLPIRLVTLEAYMEGMTAALSMLLTTAIAVIVQCTYGHLAAVCKSL